MTDTLIVIPVRAGSAGVPNKALKSLGGPSPLERVIRTAQQVDAMLVVVTNDGTVADRAEALGVTVLQLPESLAQAQIPLDAPVYWAVTQMPPHAITVTLQVTSPFTRAAMIQQAIQLVRDYQTTVVTVRDDRGLRWHAPAHDCVLTTRAPYRVVRQHMPPEWRETGAIFATPSAYVTPTFRFTHTAYLLPVTGREAVDINTPEDWALAEWYAGPAPRELLLAKVLASAPPPEMPILVFSAYREASEEILDRINRAAHLHGERLYLQDANTYAECLLALTKTRAPDLCLVTSAYHQPRAFLTMLQVAQEACYRVRLWNAPAPSSMAKWPQEVQKIERYQTLGHVASYEAGLAHLQADTSVPA